MIDKVLRTLFVVILMLAGSVGYAQPIIPEDLPPPPANPVPISGIEILIGAGALLGAKRMLSNRKPNN